MRNCKTKTRWRKTPLVALGVALMAVTLALAFVGFEIDANLETTATQDWAPGTGGCAALISTTTGTIVANSNPPSAIDNPACPGTALLFYDDISSSSLTDSSTYTQGSKETSPSIPEPPPGPPSSGPTDWEIVTGNVPPNKDDISLVYAWSDDTFDNLALALERTNILGDSHLDFSLNHLPWAACPNDADSLCPVRTIGDLLFAFDLSNGGAVFAARLFVWEIQGGADEGGGGTTGCDGQLPGSGGNLSKSCVGGKSGADEYGWEEIVIPPGAIELTINADPIPAGPWGSFGPNDTVRTTIPQYGFFEVYVDLDTLGYEPQCGPSAVASVRSRSSDSIDSALKDLAGPFEIGHGELEVSATINGTCDLDIGYSGTAAGPTGPLTDANATFAWQCYKCVGSCDTDDPPGDDLDAGTIADDDSSPPNLDVSGAGLGAGTYYCVLSVTADEGSCNGETVSNTTDVLAPITVSIAPDDTSLMCPADEADMDDILYTATAMGGNGMYTYSWSIGGDNVAAACGDSVTCLVDFADGNFCGTITAQVGVSDSSGLCTPMNSEVETVTKTTTVSAPNN